jgi:hypothetical protein
MHSDLEKIILDTIDIPSLPTVASMPLDSLMEFVFRVSDPALTPVVGFCMKSWCRTKKQDHGQYRSRK